MDDISLGSQMPEVFWDCGSPSPNTWKKCQDPELSNSAIKQEFLKLSEKKEICKKRRQPFKIDTTSLNKARSLIFQLQNRDNDPSGNSSLDKLFDQSGEQEELASSLSSVPISNGIVIPETAEPLLAEDWNDDIFPDVGNDVVVNIKQDCNASKTSTPLRSQTHKKSLNLRKRQLNSRLLFKDSTNTSSSCQSNSSPDNLRSNERVDYADPSIDFLVTFNPRDKKKSFAKRKTDSCNVIQAKRKDDSNTLQKQSKNVAVTVNSATKLTKPDSTIMPSSDVSISDEILSQLIMDDSWTVKCTANSCQVRQQVNEVPEIDTALTQILMDDDDCWTDPVTKQSKMSAVEKSCNLKNRKTASNFDYRLHPTHDKLNNQPNLSSPLSSSDELEDTYPVSLPYQDKPTTVSRNVATKSHSCNATPNPSSALPRVLSKQSSHKCTAAEIEKKRQLALQRRRMRIK